MIQERSLLSRYHASGISVSREDIISEHMSRNGYPFNSNLGIYLWYRRRSKEWDNLGEYCETHVATSGIGTFLQAIALLGRILGYGTAVAVGVPVVIIALVWSYDVISDILEFLLCSICEKKASWKRQKPEDPEGDPSQKK